MACILSLDQYHHQNKIYEEECSTYYSFVDKSTLSNQAKLTLT